MTPRITAAAIGLLLAAALAAGPLATRAKGDSGSPAGQRTGRAAQARPAARAKYAPDQLLVRFRRGVDKFAMRAEHARMGAEVLREFRLVDNLHLVRLPAGTSVKHAARSYRARPDVLYAEPNYRRHTDQSSVTPNDPRYAELWNLHNTGQSGGTPGADIEAPEAWGLSTGSGNVVVAIIDTGIDYNHPDLNANIFRNAADCDSNGRDDDANGYADDCHGIDTANHNANPMDDAGHGTHVAGIIGASGNNAIGVVGINWSVQLLACKFLDESGSGWEADAITCLEYVADMKDRGVNVVATNNSWGGGPSSQALFDAIDAHRQRGILFIAAAGNARANNDFRSFYPANYELPNILSVAATDHNDALAWFSNFGRHSVHLGAPGVNILSTVPGSIVPELYLAASGTSMAAPHVTGVAALLAAQDPLRDWKAIKNLILAGGDAIPSLANTISRKRLNARGALACSNSLLQERLLPEGEDAYVSAGGSLTFIFLNINCAEPNGLVEVPVDGGVETLILTDDGLAPDLEADDGLYVGQRQWFSSEVGDHTLVFPNNDVLTVHVLPPLSPYAYTTDVPFAYREIAGTDLHLRDDDSAMIRPPFPIQFGGVNFPTLNVNTNGNVTFSGPFIEWENSPLPAPGTITLVAPFWDDLYTTFDTIGTGRWEGIGSSPQILDAADEGSNSVRWDVLGSAPYRELVIEWRDVSQTACWVAPGHPYAKFQIVFFEGSSDILFNYADVTFSGFLPWEPFEGCWEEVNAGVSATVGVQSDTNLANQFSYLTRSLTANSSILWRTGDLTPSITQLSPVSVLTGAAEFSLRVTGRSFLPGAVVRWNGSDRPTTFVHGSELRATIPAADVATPGTAEVTVLNQGPNAGGESAPALFHIYSSHPVPTLTGLVPDTIALDSLDWGRVVTLTGTGFVSTSVARWNGLDRATTVLSSTQLEMSPSRPDDLLVAGPVEVTVFNPSPGGGTSNPLTLQVFYPVPVLDSVEPAYVGAGAREFDLWVRGLNFTPASVVRWNGSDRPTTTLTNRRGIPYDTVLIARIPATDVAAPGTAQVTVFNPAPEGGASDALTVTIVTPPPNDNFANATLIPTYPFSQTQSAVGATTEALDPRPLCQLQPPNVEETVWFRFTPPAAGAVVSADTLGSDYQTFLSAWTGSPGNFVNAGCAFYVPLDPLNPPPLRITATSTSPVYFMVSTAWLGTARTLVFNLNVGPGFRLEASPTTATVPRGSSATYTVTVTPQFGSFNDPIALSCSVAPAGPTCSLSATSLTPGSTPTSVTLTVATSTMAELVNPHVPPPVFAFWLALPIIGLLATRRRLPGRKKIRFPLFLAFILLAAILGLQIACGGGSSLSTPFQQTQSFTITVTGTSGTITQQTSIRLTVTL